MHSIELAFERENLKRKEMKRSSIAIVDVI